LGNRVNKRVVITGMGCVTPVGNDVDTTWRNLLEGVSGIDYAKRFDASTFPSKILGEVKDFELPELNGNLKKYTRRGHQLGIAAGIMAIKDADLTMADIDPAKIGISVGIGGVYPDLDQLRYYYDFSKENEWDHKAFARNAKIPPTWAFQRTPQTLSCVMAKLFKTFGPNITCHTACASGAHAIRQAFSIIQRGDAKIMITGGADSVSNPFLFIGLALLGALSTRKIEPQKASRPFDAQRDGFVHGEGAGMLVLEELSSALERQANIYAEIGGCGTSSNAYRVTDFPADGLGPKLAMERTLTDAGIRPSDIQYINAHGTSTIQNDISETVAIKSLFGRHAYDIPVSSIKSCIGHLIAGAGAVEAVITALTVKENLIPPTINYEYKDPHCDLDYVPNKMRAQRVDYALSNSFGFGGQNVCILIKKFSG
jgi:3-oxoacyl-[acyl-carrier-protein] synthase II